MNENDIQDNNIQENENQNKIASQNSEEANNLNSEEAITTEPISDSNPENTSPLTPGNDTPDQTVPSVQYELKKSTASKVLKTVVAGVFFFSCGFGGTFAANKFSANSGTVITQVKVLDNTEGVTQTSTNSLQDTIANISPTVVEILSTESEETNAFNQTYTAQSAGSGVIITGDGYIVTNYHVIEGSTSIQVTLTDGSLKEATVIGSDSRTDLAILKIEGTNYPFAELADSDAIRVGDTAIAIGNPLGELGGSVTTGIVSATDREVTIDNITYNLIQTNAEINRGNSGGGLFNDQGLLIGIVNAKNGGTDIEGIGFAIPSNQVEKITTQLIKYGYVADRAALGVYIQEITQDTEVYPAGVYVTGFTDDSAASTAGIKQYDRIVSIDGETISSYAQLAQILDAHSVSDKIEVVVSRSGEDLTIQITLQAYTQQVTQ